MIISGIYRIKNKINDKFYIGSSDNVHRRFSRHLLDLEKNRHDNQHLQNAWNKYSKDAFVMEILRQCDSNQLLIEEQKDLDIWVGNILCYNMRKDARCPVAPGEHRSDEVKQKISAAQKGKSKWTEEQKKQMSIDRLGRKHSPETLEKLKLRPKSCYTGIVKAQEKNIGRIYSDEHRINISNGKYKYPKIFTVAEKEKISRGVKAAVLEGRYHKNKISKDEYETIKGLYLSKTMSQQQLSFKYGINPSSMSKLLKRIGAK